VADPRLDLGIKTALLARHRILGGLRLYILHDLFHASPRVKSLQLQELSIIWRSLQGANSNFAGKFRERRELLLD
jgi:hypothetical protein